VRHKQPEVGDGVLYSFGGDKQGRPGAKQAVHHNDSARLRAIHGVILVALLTAPASAVWRIATGNALWLLAGWYAGASALTYFAYADDKKRSRSAAWRVPENTLHLLELAGGWPGAFLAQRRLRHKCSKASFQFVFWMIVAAHQFVAIDYLLGWRMTYAVKELATR
jgi:uncharacterized membrane protein YsdA (DUF1294 family)